MTAPTLTEHTELQRRILMFRGHCGIVSVGGRGGGKSVALVQDLLDHCRNPSARPIVLRESWAGLQELSDEIYDLAVLTYGTNVVRNRQAGLIRIPSGAQITLSNLGDEKSYAKLQGRSFSGIYADESGNYPPQAWALLDRLMSNLRSGRGVGLRIHLTANPQGKSHQLVKRRFIDKAPAWQPWKDENDLPWVVVTSSYLPTPSLPPTDYKKRILHAAGGDELLADAWLAGSWDVLGGAMFSPWSPDVHIVQQWPDPARYQMRKIVGCDWGTASPAVALLVGELSQPVAHFRAGDFIVLDEQDTVMGSDLSRGRGHSVPAFADEIKALVERNGISMPQVVCDDARGLDVGETVCKELNKCGIPAHPPYSKDRCAGWTLIRQMLQAAVERTHAPALWVTNRCPHLIETIPEAPRYDLRPEDIDPRWNLDHHLDALRYSLRGLYGMQVTSSRVIGMY